MLLTQHLKIDNSLESAIKEGNGRRTTAEFYKKLMKKVEWRELLQEAYLIAPLENVKNDENGITPYNQCDFQYAHHEIRDEKLVLSITKLKKAFLSAVEAGVWKHNEEAKRHLERHLKEVFDFNENEVFISDFNDVYQFIEKKIRHWCKNAAESDIVEISNEILEDVKRSCVIEDAQNWLNDKFGKVRIRTSVIRSALNSVIWYFGFHLFDTRSNFARLHLTEEDVKEICNEMIQCGATVAAEILMDRWNWYCKEKNEGMSYVSYT